MSLQKAIHRHGHVGQFKGISQMPQPGFEVLVDGGGFLKTTVEEALDQEGGQIQISGQLSGPQRFGWSDGPAVFHGWNQSWSKTFQPCVRPAASAPAIIAKKARFKTTRAYAAQIRMPSDSMTLAARTIMA